MGIWTAFALSLGLGLGLGKKRDRPKGLPSKDILVAASCIKAWEWIDVPAYTLIITIGFISTPAGPNHSSTA